MIPKVIHYCWFGRNEKSRAVLDCMESWKKYCPDYEIVEWNEDNYDVNSIPFISNAYKAGKWAFVSDYARLDIIYNHGGIYLDTDVELIKNIDPLLSLDAFAGFEGDATIATGLGFGAVRSHPMVKALKDDYLYRKFPENGDYMSIACPVINTEVFAKYGFVPNGTQQMVNGMMLFPKEYFNPKSNQTYLTQITENTYSIHHYDASWKKGSSAYKQKLIRAFSKIFGEKNLLRLKKLLKKQ